MLRGLTTNERYEECLKAGFCKDHLKELEIKDDAEGYELQRKAMLYIRLQIFAPLLFNKPFSSEKMKTLFARSKCFPDRNTKNRDFKEAIMVLDSVVVYTLCYFSKVCCAGVFYQPSKSKPVYDPLKLRIIQLLSKKILEESDISYFNPILKENFTDFDKNLIKVSYVAALLCVRNVTMILKLGQALDRLDTELHGVSREGEKWKMIGNDSHKEKRYEEAINAFTSAINYNPYCVPLLKNRAQTYLRIKQYDSAALDYYIILVLNPMSIKSYYKLSYSLLHYNLHYESYLVAEFAMEKFKDRKHTNPKIYESLEKMRDISERNIERAFPIACKMSREKETVTSSDEEVDIPDLIEASDSENEMQDVPDLMDASDSEESESEVVNEKSRNDKNENPAAKPQNLESCYKDEKQEKQDNLYLSLQEASTTLLDGCALMAIPRYHEALNEIKTYPEVYSYEECDIMCIKYAYGCALCKSKAYDDLQKAINVFREVTEEHNTFMFPAAHYGIGLAYYKLNWFKDALGYLKAVNDIIQKEIPFKVCTWPGLTTVIEETKPEHLKVIVNDLIKECENPPPPDAVCRFDKCSLRASIYLTDPDFKGFYFIQCSEQCCLQYHPQCWKILRSLKQCTDKAFLEQKCFTPDCEGVICKIQNICKEGNVEKMFSLADTKKLAKQKRAKVVKKLEMKEEKKRKRKDSSSKSEPVTEETTSVCDNLPEVEVNDISKEPKNDAMPETSEDVPPSSLPSATTEPLIMLKKEKFVNEQPSKVSAKSKEHKKVKSNTFTIDEFLQHNQTYGNDYAQRLCALRVNNQNIIEGSWTNFNKRIENAHLIPFEVDPCNRNPFEIKGSKPLQPSVAPYTPKPQAENTDSSAGIQFFDPPIDVDVIESVKKEVYSYLKALLQKHGPLRIDDPILIDELKDFPPIANKVIADCDGVGGFLKQHMDFALVGETYVCVVADVVAAYEKQSTESQIGKLNALPSYTAYSLEGDVEDIDAFNSSYLNPDAKEYLPPNSSHVSIESASSDAAAENVNRNSPELISAISKLRQRLAVDVENSSTKSEIISKALETSHYQGNSEANYTGDLILNASSYSSGVPKNSSPQEKVTTLLEKFTAYVDLYYSEEMNQYRPYMEECIKPYSIVMMPKKINACIQTEKNEVEKVSKGTMKSDEELQRVKEITCLLSGDKQDLLKRIQLMEEEYNSAMNSAAENQIDEKEFENLKKELADLKLTLDEQRSEFQRKENMLGKESAHLLEKLKKTEEAHSSRKSEIDEMLSTSESMKTKLKQLEETVVVLQDEKQLMKQSLDLQFDKLKDNIKTLENENLQVLERAKYAEHLLLCLKKSEYLRRIDNKAAEAALRMKQLQDGISSVTGNVNPVLIKNLEVILAQIKEYIIKLHDIRKNFMAQIDEQINQVNNGISLKEIKPIDMAELPDIPSWTNIALNAQSPCWTSQIQLLSAAYNTVGRNTLSYPPPKLPEAVNPQMRQPNPLMRAPPQIPVEKESDKPTITPTVNKQASSVQNLFAASNPPVVKPRVVDLKKMQAQTEAKSSKSDLLGAASKESLASVAASADIRKSGNIAASSTLELDYNIKKSEAKKTVPSTAVSQESLYHEPKNSYEKLLHKLHLKFPEYTQPQLMDFVKEFREQRKGKLSGLSMDSIISEVSLVITKRKVSPTLNDGSRSRPNPTVLVNKNLVSDETSAKKLSAEINTEKKCPWAKGDDSSKQWSGNNIEDGCIICYEDMSRNPYRVDCGHCFHFKCIKEWLSKKSDCPICRVHLLLPDDYPVLK